VPTLVFLDTNIYVACALANKEGAHPELLQSLMSSLASADAVLLLPDVVLGECGRVLQRELEKHVQQLEGLKKTVNQSLVDSEDRRALERTLERIVNERRSAATTASEFVTALTLDLRVARIPLTPEALVRAVDSAVKGEAPSARARRSSIDDGTGARGLLEVDCLIVASLADHIGRMTAGECRLLFCSDNHRDFALWDEQQKRHVLHPDVAARLGCEASYYRRLDHLLTHGLGAAALDAAAVEDLNSVLASIEREGIRWELVAAQERLAMAEKAWAAAERELEASCIRQDAVRERFHAAFDSAQTLDENDPDAPRLLEFVNTLCNESEAAEDDVCYAKARSETAKLQVTAIKATVAQLERELRGGERSGADSSVGG